MTFFAAGLIGAGVVAIGVAAAAVARRLTRARRPRSEASLRPPVPRPGRPGPVPGRSGHPGPATRGPDPRPRVPGTTAVGGPQGGGPYRAPHLPEALDGETLQLHAVPAWRLPIRTQAGGVAAGSPAPSPRSASTVAEPASTPASGGPVPLLGRRPGEYSSVAARPADDEPDGQVEPTRVNRDPREAWEGRPGTSVVTNASRRHDPRTATGRTPGR